MNPSNKTDPVEELQSANEHVGEIPKQPELTTCELQKVEETQPELPVNIVEPHIEAIKPAWFHEKGHPKWAAGVFDIWITESEQAPPYAGKGTLTVPGEIQGIFRDITCEIPFPNPTPLEDLKKRTPVFAKFGKPDTAHLILTLDKSEDPHLDIKGPADALLPVKPVNVVEPVAGESEDGRINAQVAEKSKGSVLGFDVRQSNGDPAYTGTGTISVEGGEAELFLDGDFGKPVPPKLKLKDFPLRVFVKPVKPAKLKLKLTLTDEKDPRILVLGPVSGPANLIEVNIVTPRIVVDKEEGWFDSEVKGKYDQPAEVTVSLTESTGDPVYNGEGTVTATKGAVICREGNVLNGTISAADLRGGVKLTIHGTEPGKPEVTLKLSDVPNPLIYVAGTETKPVTMRQVNVLTPVIKPVEGGKGWLGELLSKPHPAAFSVQLMHVDEARKYPGQVAIRASGGAELFEDSDCDTPLPPNIPASRIVNPLRLFARGKGIGSIKLFIEPAEPDDNTFRLTKAIDESAVEFEPINIVKPCIEPVEKTGWASSEHKVSVAAKVQAWIEESNPHLPYTGEATVSCPGCSLFYDKELSEPATKLSVPDLRSGKVPLFVKGADPGDPAVKLSLGKDPDLRVVPSPASASTPVEFKPVNVVAPKVIAVEEPGWVEIDEKIWIGAKVKVSITESNSAIAYEGEGSVTCADGGELFENDDLSGPVTKIAAGSLRGEGKLLYVKGAKAGSPQVTLKLDAPADARVVRPLESKAAAVEIKPINVVKVKITPECKAILVNKNLKAKQTGPEAKVAASERTKVVIELEESTGAPPYSKTGTLDVPDHVKVYDVEKDGDAIDLKKALSAEVLKNKKTYYLEGVTAGECKVKVTLEKDPTVGIHTIQEKEEKMVSVQLDMEVYKFNRADPWDEVALSETEKIDSGRILHVQDAGKYSRAKIVVKKPAAELWDIAGDGFHVKLEISNISGGGELCGAAAGGGGASTLEIQKGDFGVDGKEVWLEGTGEVTALRGVRVQAGLSGTAAKKYGDWAAFTVVKIEKVSPFNPGYVQHIRQTPVNVLHPLDLGPKYEAEAKLTKAIAGIDIFYTIIADPGNAKYPNIPKEWMCDNPTIPVTKATDGAGSAKELVTFSKLKNGLHGYDKNHFQVGAYLADDPVNGLANPIKSNDIEIDAPAQTCACCGLGGHSAGCGITATEWYEQLNFSDAPDPVVYRATRAAYQNGILNVANRGVPPIGPCSCPSALATTHPPPGGIGNVTNDLLPRGGGCATFFAPVTTAEHQKIIKKWDDAKKKATHYVRAKNIIDPPYTAQMDRQINHLVSKSAGGCATGFGNLQANGWLCAHCQSLDAPFSAWQGRRAER
jgi:hypothetical protein